MTNHDYRLLPQSGCIDIGNPDPNYNDPDGSQSDLGAMPFEGLPFLCGDGNSDEIVNILDITFVIGYLYLEGPPPEYLNAIDVNSSEQVNILDITQLINFLYNAGPDPYCIYEM